MASPLANRPLFTETIDDVAAFVAGQGCVYVSSASNEPRSLHVRGLERRSPDCSFVALSEQAREGCVATIGATRERLPVASMNALGAFWAQVSESAVEIYLDITGLEHHVWAPLVAAAVRSKVALKVVYVEPTKYRRNETTGASTELFDLSAGFEGVAPLPGFVTLANPDDDEFYLIPLLGFEGRRFSYILNEVAPAGERVFPVIGVPGFQPEFVTFAYDGNRVPLLEGDAWQRVSYATANCPFSLFYLLADLAAENPDGFFKIAPIGTKPHGLGAVLFAIANPRRVELVYDFPRRKDKRTDGAARLLLYDIDALMRTQP